MSETSPESTEKVGFRDIYRAVEGAESRIKEHISLALLPFATQLAEHSGKLADHEGRIRAIEELGSTEARLALANTVELDARVTVVEKDIDAGREAGIERRRLAGITNKSLAAIVIVAQFVLGILVFLTK